MCSFVRNVHLLSSRNLAVVGLVQLGSRGVGEGIAQMT